MTAIRETFEETGLLLASATLRSTDSESGELPRSLDASRESIHKGRTLFRDFLKQHALDADVKALLPFTEWITPLGYPRCVAPLLLLSHTLTHRANDYNCTTNTHTAGSTRVSTSLSCPLTASRPCPRPRPASPLE